jgi:nucleoside-diphosphate-sugar epimerase
VVQDLPARAAAVTVLVTGATGFIGRRLLARLDGRQEVVAVARADPPAALARLARWIALDLSVPLDARALPARVDTVLHLAQSPRFREFPGGAADMRAVNVDAPAALAEYAERAGARRFVLASTGGVYAPGPAPLREDGPVAPSGFYPATRYAAELLLAPYAERFATVVLRPFFVYGATQRGFLVANLAARVLAGEPVTVQGLHGPRLNPLHVDDAARAVEAALALDAPAVVNLAGDEVTSVADLARGLAAAAGAEPAVEHAGDADPPGLVADNTRMKALLGVTPAVPLAAGLRGVIEELRG